MKSTLVLAFVGLLVFGVGAKKLDENRENVLNKYLREVGNKQDALDKFMKDNNLSDLSDLYNILPDEDEEDTDVLMDDHSELVVSVNDRIQKLLGDQLSEEMEVVQKEIAELTATNTTTSAEGFAIQFEATNKDGEEDDEEEEEEDEIEDFVMTKMVFGHDEAWWQSLIESSKVYGFGFVSGAVLALVGITFIHARGRYKSLSKKQETIGLIV